MNPGGGGIIPICLYLDSEFFEDIVEVGPLMSFCDTVAIVIPPSFGYTAIIEEQEEKNMTAILSFATIFSTLHFLKRISVVYHIT